MSDFTGIIIGIVVLVILRLVLRFLPKWFGGLMMVGYLGFIVWLVITHGHGHLVSTLIVLFVGEFVLAGIWVEELTRRKQRGVKELEKMQAKDMSSSDHR